MSDISLPYRPRPAEDPQAAGVVQSNLEYFAGLFQKGVADGDVMKWDAIHGKWIAVPPASVLPVDFTGKMMPWPNATPPSGWVFCDGTLYNGTLPAYTPLWNVIGTTFGGSGQNSFAVPDCQGRAIYGVGAGTPGVGSIGANEGNPNVVLRGPHHPHSISDPGHRHPANFGGPGGAGKFGDVTTHDYDQGTVYTEYATTGITVGSAGYSTTNAPSHIAIPWVIKL